MQKIIVVPATCKGISLSAPQGAEKSEIQTPSIKAHAIRFARSVYLEQSIAPPMCANSLVLWREKEAVDCVARTKAR